MYEVSFKRNPILKNRFDKVLKGTLMSSEDIWDALLNKGYIDANGELTSLFQPWESSFSLDINVEAKDIVLESLKQAHQMPMGFCDKVVEGGTQVDVIQKGFFTEENEVTFYKILDNTYSIFLAQSKLLPSQIDHFLILLDKNTSKAKVYINELTIFNRAIAKGRIEKGQLIKKNEIAGIVEVGFKDLKIPQDNGIIFFFSSGWHRGLYFNLAPLTSTQTLENIEKDLAQYYEYFIFYELFKSENIEKCYALGWFPFIPLIGGQFEKLIETINGNLAIDNIENEIFASFNDEKLMGLLTNWKKQEEFSSHIDILTVGVRRHIEKDYVSAINNIWPRIEGILIEFNKKYQSPEHLTENIVESISNENCPISYLPKEFKNYLDAYYFKGFDKNPVGGNAPLSRTSIAHGLVTVDKYDAKRSLIGILIIDQLSYYFNLLK